MNRVPAQGLAMVFLALFLAAPAWAKTSPETLIYKANKALTSDPNDAKAYYNRGTAQMELGNFTAAVEDLTQSIRLEPDAADAYFNRGLAYRYQKINDRALEDFSKAITLYPDHWAYVYERCNVRIVSGDYAGAVTDGDDLVRLAPKEATSHFMRALALHLGGDSEAALASVEAALQIKNWHKDALRLKEEILAARSA